MRRVSSRQRLVSWDAFDATAASDSELANESSCSSYADESEEESFASGYEAARSRSFESSTALERRCENNMESQETDRKGSKLWTTRRRKRDRKNKHYGTERYYARKSKNNPKTSPAFPSTTEGVTAIVSSYSWEISKPTPPSKTVEFDDLIDDLYLGIFSFLDLSSLRSVMSVNHRFRNLMVTDDARSGVWMDHCEKLWCIKRKNHDGIPLSFVDNLDFPTAVTTLGSEGMARKSGINFSFLLSHTSAKFPTSIDKDTLYPRRRLRRDIQQTIPEFRVEEEEQLIRCYKDSSTGRSIVQYTGLVGQGDRCIRSEHPLPRPTRTMTRNTSNAIGAACLGIKWQNESYRPSLFDMLRSSSKSINRDRSKASSSSTSERMSDWAPFVAPFVNQEIDGRTTTVNITPRFVSYFEVSILDLKDNTADGGDIIPSNDGAPTQRRYRTSYKDCIAIGVSTRNFQYQSRMPGWDQQSYGYHGDDGGIFHSSGGMLKQFGPKFGPGDTVGCGIDYISHSIFFTLNGDFLGYAWDHISDEILQKDLFPVVGIDANSPIHVNYGSVDSGPFQFDLSRFIKKHKKLISSMYSLDEFCGSRSTNVTANKTNETSLNKAASGISSSRRRGKVLVRTKS